MGCFPERTVPRYHSLPNERERLMKGIYSPGKNMDSVLAPINTTADTTGPPRTARPYASPNKKKAVSPADPRSNPNSRFKRQQPSLDKSAEKQKRKLGRKQEEERPQRMERKKGRVIELPFRPHIITKIETPSDSVRTSILTNLENNPSLFFVKLNERDIEKVFIPATESRLAHKSLSPNKN